MNQTARVVEGDRVEVAWTIPGVSYHTTGVVAYVYDSMTIEVKFDEPQTSAFTGRVHDHYVYASVRKLESR